MIDSFTGRYYWLSNFYHSPVTMFGEIYPTVEHAFQAAKCPAGKEHDAVRALIRGAHDLQGRPSPGHAKKLGRRVKLREDWEEVKVGLMRTLLQRKFEVPELAYLLICTKDEELVEGNTWGDRYWGQVDGVGENMLGKLLMEVRRNLQDMQAAPPS